MNNIQIECKQNQEEALKERENIMVSIKGIKESTNSLKEDRVVLGEIGASGEIQEFTFYIWLSPKTSDKLESSKISFNISFEDLS